MGSANCGCSSRNAVLVINTAIKPHYRPIDILLMPKNDTFAYYNRLNITFCINNFIGPFFLTNDANTPEPTEESKQLLNELIALTEYDKYIRTTSEVSVLEYEEFYSTGSLSSIKTLPVDQLKKHLLLNASSLFRVPLYLAMLTHPYISYAKKHNSIDHNEKLRHQIEVDLPRTFPKEPIMDKEPFMHNFRSLLYEIGGRDEKINYVQGMNFIAAFCLLISGNQLETAFILFTKVLSLKSNLFKMAYKDCFNYGFPLLLKYLAKIRELLKTYHKGVYDKIIEYDVNDHLWVSKWILTLFLSQFDLVIALKFLDVLISQGLDSILVICLTIVEIYQNNLIHTEAINEFTSIIGHEIHIDKERAGLLYEKLIFNITNKTYGI